MGKIENIKDVDYVVQDLTGCHVPIAQKGVWHESNSGDNGYVLLSINNKIRRAHRESYKFYHGDIPSASVVCHSCDNRMCINPDHLFIGTRKENQKDMKDKGRASRWEDRPLNDNGKRSHFKLSQEQIKEIRESKESSYKIAPKYGVSSVQIRRIRNGTRCKSI